jgi:amino acid transporter
MTLLILFGVVLVVLSYREVVSVYTRAGGSYVVARENFGPRVAQVAAVALLIDYVVTVAVQTAAARAAIVSAFPALSGIPVFALPTYLFAGSLVVMIVTGIVREMTGGLPHVADRDHLPGAGVHVDPPQPAVP